MADIELTIKIPEEIRLALINNIQLSLDQQSFMDSCIKQAIINGVKLPKGYGRLIDANILKEHIDKLPCLPDGNFAGNHSALKALINMQSTIIEADTESEE